MLTTPSPFLNWFLSQIQGIKKNPGSFETVDLERFSGLWYEVARTPNWFEKGCEFATAEYTLSINPVTLQETIQVVNTCYRKGSPWRTVRGVAFPTFIPFGLSVHFGTVNRGMMNSVFPNYIISWISPNYQRAVILSPLGNVWFLSRSPHITEEEYKEMFHHVPYFLRQHVIRNKIQFST